ncbi:unnamed protein product [Notodromas monacha]|uniref:Uncharacterized protein n=1 Tax=Notodromas monacha TaxID=399045 RepID=A0A7R9BJL9_9CRUS|nr:unnamed protein product [Notodromas monacha]CAG0915350.1 unnamed protein product [Notodromas monacha]
MRQKGKGQTLDFNLSKKGTSRRDLLKICENAVKYSVRTSHPYFRNQLYGGVDPYALAGTWLSEALNTNQYTFEVAPFFMTTERAILKKIREIIGWPDGRGDGIFAPGGSTGNMYGIVAARYNKFPESKVEGMFGLPRLTLFISQDAHYSSIKAAHWLGFGTKSVIAVPTDELGRMIPEELEKCKCGAVPFCVVATSGTTVLGAFDPLEAIAKICRANDIWLHVDACWGGSALLSKKHRHLMKGVENADSLIWNPHKMLGAPLQCSPFVIRHEGLLHKCNSASATYLFQQDKFYDVSYDTGDKSFQCGRKVDGFKLWTMWKARGDNGLEALVSNTFQCAEYVHELIKNRPGFKMVIPEVQCTNVCFWYIPECLRNLEETEEWWTKMEKVAPEIKRRMTVEGSLLIGYQPLKHKNLRNFFRLVLTCQPPLTTENMDFVVSEIDRLGRDMIL